MQKIMYEGMWIHVVQLFGWEHRCEDVLWAGEKGCFGDGNRIRQKDTQGQAYMFTWLVVKTIPNTETTMGIIAFFDIFRRRF